YRSFSADAVLRPSSCKDMLRLLSVFCAELASAPASNRFRRLLALCETSSAVAAVSPLADISALLQPVSVSCVYRLLSLLVSDSRISGCALAADGKPVTGGWCPV